VCVDLDMYSVTERCDALRLRVTDDAKL